MLSQIRSPMLSQIDLPLATSASVESVALVQWGNPQGKPLLFVHGWLDNSASFFPLSSEFLQFNCMAIDLPGHGHSAHKKSHYHFIDWVDDLYQIMSALYEQNYISVEYEQLALVGHSLGALISSVLASAFPEKVSQLVMIEGLGPLSAPIEGGVSQLRRSVLARSRSNRKKNRIYPSIDSAVNAWQQVSGLNNQQARLIVERNLKAAGNGWCWQYDQALTHRSPLRMTKSQAQYFSQQITCPVLLIKAQQGSYISSVDLSERGTWFQNLSVCELGQGHHLHMDPYYLVADEISAFITV